MGLDRGHKGYPSKLIMVLEVDKDGTRRLRGWRRPHPFQRAGLHKIVDKRESRYDAKTGECVFRSERDRFYDELAKSDDPAWVAAQAAMVTGANKAIVRSGDPSGILLTGRARNQFKKTRLQPGHQGRLKIKPQDVLDPEVGYHKKRDFNVRENPLKEMRLRDQIDDFQFDAGDRFREFYECCLFSSGVIDPSRTPVQCSWGVFTIQDAAIYGAQRLSDAFSAIGGADYNLVRLIAAEGRLVKEAAKLFYGLTQDDKIDRASQEHISRRLKEALSRLASLWGIMSDDTPRRIVAKRPDGPQVIREEFWEFFIPNQASKT